jgi:hypothetical protein
MPSYLGTRRTLFYSGAARPVTLPRAGPFASRPITLASSLSSQSLIGGTLTITGSDCSESNPLKYNHLTMSGASILAYAPSGGEAVDFAICGAIFNWVNIFDQTNGSAAIRVDGGNGGSSESPFSTTSGGHGASGGGGGAISQSGCGAPGGLGGNGDDGASGGSDTCCYAAAQGGIGVALSNAYTYTYGNGGAGGGNGFGKAGNGGDAQGAGCPCYACGGFGWGGNGPAGGGLNVMVGNSWIGSGNMIITTSAGTPSAGGGWRGNDGTAAGNGVVWWAFVHKSAPAPVVAAETSNLYQIDPVTMALTLRNWSDTW